MSVRSLEKLLKYKGVYMALFPIESAPNAAASGELSC